MKGSVNKRICREYPQRLWFPPFISTDKRKVSNFLGNWRIVVVPIWGAGAIAQSVTFEMGRHDSTQQHLCYTILHLKIIRYYIFNYFIFLPSFTSTTKDYKQPCMIKQNWKQKKKGVEHRSHEWACEDSVMELINNTNLHDLGKQSHTQLI